MTENAVFIGQRIVSNDLLATIKYIGTIEGTGTEDIWYGVEWDDPSRGKHNGSYKGKQYFQTKHETGGSFLRANKIDFGVDIYDAAKDKYIEDDNGTENTDDIIYCNSDFLDKLKCVSFAYCKIRSANSLTLIKTSFPNIRELELEGNLFYSWQQIFPIIDTLKSIKLLNVSNNRLALPDKENISKFENIEYLVMNRMECNWTDVVAVLEHFPRVQQLKVCFNSITTVNVLSENMVKNLKLIDMESNPLNDWGNLIKLGELEMLEDLNLSNTGISSIYFNDAPDSEKTKLFPGLKSLSISQNKIDSWSSVNELNKINQLEELKFVANPLMETVRVTEFRDYVIAKIENLQIYNRTKLNIYVNSLLICDERKDAEFFYLKHFFGDYLKAKNDNRLKEFNIEHPRYAQLIEKYGLPEVQVIVQPETVKSNLISLNIVNDVTKEKLVRKIPSTMTIQRLKNVIVKMFPKSDFENDSVKLMYKSSKQVGDDYELENEFRDLKFYSVEDGDTIEIVELQSRSKYEPYIRILS